MKMRDIKFRVRAKTSMPISEEDPAYYEEWDWYYFSLEGLLKGNGLLKWCDDNGVVSQTIITKCMIATCIWVAQMRCEPISFGEIYDLLGIPTEVAIDPNNPANFDDVLSYTASDMELEEILEDILKDGV